MQKIGKICNSTTIRSTVEVIERLKEYPIEEDEILVSYDVKVLFPSIPEKEALLKLEEWIEKHDSTPYGKRKAKVYSGDMYVRKLFYF